MSTVIYTFADSNMAGQEWRWSFTLARAEDDTLELNALQEFIDGDEDDEPLKINPRSGIEVGADLYEAFGAMLDEAGVEIETISLGPIAQRVAKIDAKIAADFRNGAKIIEARFEAEARRQDRLRAIKLIAAPSGDRGLL